jgi:hypothetical protein
MAGRNRLGALRAAQGPGVIDHRYCAGEAEVVGEVEDHGRQGPDLYRREHVYRG